MKKGLKNYLYQTAYQLLIVLTPLLTAPCLARALGRELRNRGISVTAVCPGPVDTPFFKRAEEYQKRRPGKDAFLADPKKVVKKALRDAMHRRPVSIYGFSMKGACLAGKILPADLLMWAFEKLF